MIFVTLGSQKFQFNRLLKKLDDLVKQGVIKEEIFAQIGYSDYHPKRYNYKEFLNRDDFSEIQLESDIIITHGGTGAIIGAVKKGKKVIVVPRLAKYGEHVDDHQIQIIEQFESMGIIEACYDINNLGNTVSIVKDKEYLKYSSNTNKIIESIDEFIINLKI